MTGAVTPNSMIILVNDTIQKNTVAQIGSNAAVQIVRRDLPVRRVLLAREVLPVPKEFPESEVPWVRKVLRVYPALLALRVP